MSDQVFSRDMFQVMKEESLNESHVHNPLGKNATKSTTGDVASKSSSDSGHSGVSQDSGYVSIDGGSSASTFSVSHPHWCLICDIPHAIMSCDGWKRHVKEHEITYPCLVCGSQANLSRSKAPRFSWEVFWAEHLEKHGTLRASVEGRRTKKKKYYSCGFCGRLFEDLAPYLTHVDDVHFKSFQTLEDWDENKIIMGLLLQTEVQRAWRRILASHNIPLPERLGFS